MIATTLTSVKSDLQRRFVIRNLTDGGVWPPPWRLEHDQTFCIREV
ncbi:hypothetical protein HCH_01960 [Hahella chejuensis KCTC 2396]|uniref:Uncharacterized protein n=1 Tax=Hahella chejuensis (strain KCTC 2396) TaxID=349521 RepID=Q2SKN1_HAHCH|nr:hypothetical protein HCH_01960 [Hahella chejuensis KCTC 2396]